MCWKKKPQRKIHERVIFFMLNLFNTDNIFFKPVFYAKKVIFLFFVIKEKYLMIIFFSIQTLHLPAFFSFCFGYLHTCDINRWNPRPRKLPEYKICDWFCVMECGPDEPIYLYKKGSKGCWFSPESSLVGKLT